MNVQVFFIDSIDTQIFVPHAFFDVSAIFYFKYSAVLSI